MNKISFKCVPLQRREVEIFINTETANGAWLFMFSNVKYFFNCKKTQNIVWNLLNDFGTRIVILKSLSYWSNKLS